MTGSAYVRFQSAVPNRRGTFPGVFAMVNGLRDAGMLTFDDEAWVRENNARGDREYTDPSTVVADCYDAVANLGACSWFRDDATELLSVARRYTRVLDRYGVPWTELRTARPGRIVYEDAVQVVAVPFAHEAHWPLPAPPR